VTLDAPLLYGSEHGIHHALVPLVTHLPSSRAKFWEQSVCRFVY
jgi:hypothetical protein